MTLIKKTGFLILEFVLLILFYLVVLTVANSGIQKNAFENMQKAVEIIDEEGDYPKYFDDEAARLDNYTDRIMVQKCMIADEKPFLSALSMNGYARYWHGYAAFLKPLFSILELVQIRKLLSFLLFLTAAVTMVALYKKGGAVAAVSFALMWAEYYSQIVAGSFQYFWCYFICCVSTTIVCLLKEEKKGLLFYFFFAIGSFVNFIDLLTFPLITLTIPLLATFFTKNKEGVIKRGFLYTILWGTGYAMTWLAKWVLCRIFLGEGIIPDVSNAISYRMTGDEINPINRILVIRANLQHPYLLHRIPLLFAVLFLSLILFLIFAKAEKMKKMRYMLGMLPVFFYPFIWYEILCNHSLVHHFFTYRALMGTSFGLYFILLSLWKGIYEALSRKKEKR